MDQNQAQLHTKQNQEIHDPSTSLVTTLNKPQKMPRDPRRSLRKIPIERTLKCKVSIIHQVTEKTFFRSWQENWSKLQLTTNKTGAALQQQQTQHSSEIWQLEIYILNKNLKQHIELFQAGRTKSCLAIWRSLTSDCEILATISGLPIELEREIPLELRTHNCSQAQLEIIDNEIQKLLKKKVIVKCDHEEVEIISPTFLKEKPDGSFRFVLNLKKLNENITKIHFKMEAIMLILKLVTPLTYFTKIDLKDAHYTNLQITKIYTNSHACLMVVGMDPENLPKY